MLPRNDAHNTLYLNSKVFAPMLDDDLVARNPTLHIKNPLTVVDFAKDNFSDTFIKNLNNTTNTIAYGFQDNKPDWALNKEQWLQAAAQIMAAIHQGLYKAFPLEDTLEFLASLRPDDTTAAGILTVAAGALNYYLKNTSGTQWKQCACCLRVAGDTISEDRWEAELLTCNQHADATRLLIINTTIRETQIKAERQRDLICSTAKDQVVLSITNSNPSPFSTDPCIKDWVTRLVNATCIDAEAMATDTAVQEANHTYKSQLEHSTAALEANLQCIHDHTVTILAQVREVANAEIAAFKADLKAEHDQHKANLEHDRLMIWVTKRRENCPTPITTQVCLLRCCSL